MIRLIRKSFVRRLTFWYLGIFITALLAASHHITRSLEQQTIHRLTQSLENQANYTHHLLVPYFGNRFDRQNIQPLMEAVSQDIDTRVTVIGLDGVVLGDTEVDFGGLMRMDNHASRPEIRVALAGGVGRKTRYSNTLKTRMLYVAKPLLNRDEVYGVIRMAMPATQVQETVEVVRRQVLATTVFGIVMILILGILMGRSFARRVNRLKFAASEFAAGRLTQSVDIGGEDEMQELAGSMNFMANNLTQKIKQIEIERLRFKAILQNIAEGVIAVNADLQIQIMNSTAESMFDATDSEASQKPFLEVIKNTRADDLVRRAIRQKEVIQKEVEFIRDQVHYIKLSAVGLSESREGIAAIVVFYDVTDLKRLETV
ncbi:MAG: PAS domain-containing protein, partial [Candidatus Omnitrophica bacterium]|nr:PAS domain-containing protein [Candidatus Omnitrophota bacterium]